MSEKCRMPGKIVGKFWEAEILISQGKTMLHACKQISVSEQKGGMSF